MAELIDSTTILLEKEVKSCVVVERINRFTVKVKIGTETMNAHINNTGRLQDLLITGREAYCYLIPGSKLRYRLYAVKEHYGFALIDTYLQEKSFEVIVKNGLLKPFGKCLHIKGRPRVKSTFYDYLLSCDNDSFLVEIKSATMRLKGVYASYPDTRTDRGVRHIASLPDDAKSMKAKPALVFIAGLRKVEAIVPNYIAEPRILAVINDSVKKGLLIHGLSIYVDDKDPQKIIIDNLSLPFTTITL